MSRRPSRSALALIAASALLASVGAVGVRAASSISMLYSPKSAVANEPASFTAQVSPIRAGATVGWEIDGRVAATSTTNPNGIAQWAWSFSPGQHGIRALLQPSSVDTYAESSVVSLEVARDPGNLPDLLGVDNIDGTLHTVVSGDDVSVLLDRGGSQGAQLSFWAYDLASGRQWLIRLDTGRDQPIDATTYAIPTSIGAGYFFIGHDSSGCGGPARVRFESIAYDPSGVPISFAMSFEVTCNGVPWPLVGRVRFNDDIDLAGLTLPRADPRLGSVRTGDTEGPVRFPVTNDGEKPLSFGVVTIAGSDAGTFAITSDTCSGTTLDPDETCAVDLIATPRSAGDHEAALVMPAALELGPRSLRIFAFGLIPTTLSLPTVAAETTYFAHGISYTSRLSPNPQANFGECLVDGRELPASIPDAAGDIRCIEDAPASGSHQVRIHYDGSVTHAESWSPTYDFTIDPTTTTTLAASTLSPVSNEPTTLTATVGFGGGLAYPGGTMSIVDQTTGTTIGSGAVDGARRTVSVIRTFSAGLHRLVATYGGVAGAEHASTGGLDLRVGAADTVAPNVTAPTNAFAAGSIVNSGKVPTKVSWSGSDATSGIARYELAQSTDGTLWSTVSSNLTTTSSIRSLGSGHTYRFRVRAVDRAGNTSGWAYGTTFRLSGYQESSSAIHYHGTWHTGSTTSYWAGYDRYTTATGAYATFTFTGRSFAWVNATSISRGSAKVYVNGVYTATVNLNASSATYRKVVFAKSWSTSATRTITIKCVGTSGHPRIDIDALVTGS